jgi:hypothetical protein
MTFSLRTLSKKGTFFKNLGSLRSQLGGMEEWGNGENGHWSLVISHWESL